MDGNARGRQRPSIRGQLPALRTARPLRATVRTIAGPYPATAKTCSFRRSTETHTVIGPGANGRQREHYWERDAVWSVRESAAGGNGMPGMPPRRRYVASGKKKGCVTEWMAMPAGGRGHQSGTASGGNGPTEGTVGAGSACGRRSDRGRRLEGGDQRQWLSRSVTEHRKREGVCTIVNGRMSPAGWRGCPPAAAPRLPRRETCVGSNPLSSTSAF
jgi:hypothetical protein